MLCPATMQQHGLQLDCSGCWGGRSCQGWVQSTWFLTHRIKVGQVEPLVPDQVLVGSCQHLAIVLQVRSGQACAGSLAEQGQASQACRAD
jgi:hypothetical protein